MVVRWRYLVVLPMLRLARGAILRDLTSLKALIEADAPGISDYLATTEAAARQEPLGTGPPVLDRFSGDPVVVGDDYRRLRDENEA
jgi:hypothetical protein